LVFAKFQISKHDIFIYREQKGIELAFPCLLFTLKIIFQSLGVIVFQPVGFAEVVVTAGYPSTMLFARFI